ncbi:hypothetical protein Y032_0031g2295 [Ancylostoma ceylanicum]|uniref:Uncharacterized protein n=1 Tax=Ancylostoma ceylanicum TaxID=53326 RepID=A0A016UQD8_9BILA|nr:hypothetical protein Y032_0031g2295 [Ancylostoma ceylanicum]
MPPTGRGDRPAEGDPRHITWLRRLLCLRRKQGCPTFHNYCSNNDVSRDEDRYQSWSIAEHNQLPSTKIIIFLLFS